MGLGIEAALVLGPIVNPPLCYENRWENKKKKEEERDRHYSDESNEAPPPS